MKMQKIEKRKISTSSHDFVATDVTNAFDRLSWKEGEIYKVQNIGNVYDLSKFWLIFADIDTFQKALFDFYSEKGKDLKLDLSDAEVGLNVVVLITDRFYRGRIVRVSLIDRTCFKIFAYDFGMVCPASVHQLYHLDRKFYDVASLAVRACLAYISPERNEMWSQDAVNRLLQLTVDREIYAQVVRVQASRKILHVNLIDPDSTTRHRIRTVNSVLVKEHLAKFPDDMGKKDRDDQLYEPLTQFLHHYPSFELIENGQVPDRLDFVENLQNLTDLKPLLYPKLFGLRTHTDSSIHD